MQNKFDELAKRLAQSVTRRAALEKLSVGLGLIHWPVSTIKLGFLVLVSFWAGSAAGQVQPQPVWVATNGSSYATPRVMALDPSGNILVAGLDNGDYLTVKYDPNGNILSSAKQPGRLGELVYPPG